MVRISSIGNVCDRFLWLKHHNKKGEEPTNKQQRIFALGNAVEDILIAELFKTGIVSDQQLKVSLSKKNSTNEIVGHIDGIYTKDNEKFLLEIKSANANSFRAMKKKIPEQYMCQLQCYMAATNLTKCLFIVLNKDNCMKLTEIIEYDDQLASECITRSNLIMESSDMADKVTNKFCSFCEFRLACINDDYTSGLYIN